MYLGTRTYCCIRTGTYCSTYKCVIGFLIPADQDGPTVAIRAKEKVQGNFFPKQKQIGRKFQSILNRLQPHTTTTEGILSLTHALTSRPSHSVVFHAPGFRVLIVLYCDCSRPAHCDSGASRSHHHDRPPSIHPPHFPGPFARPRLAPSFRHILSSCRPCQHGSDWA